MLQLNLVLRIGQRVIKSTGCAWSCNIHCDGLKANPYFRGKRPGPGLEDVVAKINMAVNAGGAHILLVPSRKEHIGTHRPSVEIEVDADAKACHARCQLVDTCFLQAVVQAGEIDELSAAHHIKFGEMPMIGVDRVRLGGDVLGE